MRSALDGEPAVDHRERALGVGAVDGLEQREVGPETVVADLVVELDVHPEEPLTGAQLQGRHDVDETGVVAAACARPFVTDGVRGPPVGGGDDGSRSHRARFVDAHSHRSGRSTTVSTVGW